MLKVNVGVSRKLSKDYNSTGFTLNIEGEVCAKLDDPEAVIQRIREFYDLAEEALNDQIGRHEEVARSAEREEDRPMPANGTGTNHRKNGRAPNSSHGSSQPEPVTRKQIEYIHDIAQRKELSPKQLEDRITTIVGRSVVLDELTKQEAGQVIESLLRTRVKVG
jgi:hypothetical protein